VSATIEERLAVLEARAAEQDAHRRDRPYAERDLIKSALQWARLTTMGFYTTTNSNGEVTRVNMGQRDAAEFADIELRNMQSWAKTLLRIEASGGVK